MGITCPSYVYIVSEITASDGTGSNGAIYPDDYTTQEALITFRENERQQTVTFHINNDNDVEGPETFTLTLTKLGSGEAPQSIANVTIQEQSGNFTFIVSC